MLDNESGVQQDAHAVFYPKGSNWKDSAIVAYACARLKTDKITTADDAAKAFVEDFHANGNPQYKAKRIKKITTTTGKEAVIYHFTGDKWGNSEAVAYYIEDKTINFVVLNSRDPKLFADSLGSFEALAKSYMFVSDHPIETEKKPQSKAETERFEDIRARAHLMGETPEGKAYEKRFFEAVAKPMQDAIKASVAEKGEEHGTFTMVFVIGDGSIQKIFSPPREGLSEKAAKTLEGLKVPVPPKPAWLVLVHIVVRD